MKNSIKLFDKELREFEQYIKDKKNFAFVRFSDGELFILQNKKVILSSTQYQTGDTIGKGTYTQEEQKEFLPEKHQHFRELLLDSFVYDNKSFYKGISCRCCVGKDNFIWQLQTIYNNKEKVQNAALAEYSNLTWSNLFLNNNYKYYIENIVPLFSQFDVYLIVNEMADITTLPFYSNIKQDFRVGSSGEVYSYSADDSYLGYGIGIGYLLNKNISLDNIRLLCSNCYLSFNGNFPKSKMFCK